MLGISGFSSQSSFDTLVENLLQRERRPISALDSRKSTLSSRLNIYTDLKAKLKTLKDLVYNFSSITSSSKLDSKVGISSDTNIFTAEITSDAAVGVHSLFVSQLAKRDTVVSKRITPDDTNIATKYAGKTEEFTLTIGDGTPLTISIDFTDPNETNEDVLKRIAAALNDAGVEVTASVINDTSTSVKLSIMSNESGSVNQLTFENLGTSKLLDDLEITDKKGRVASSDTGGGYIEVDTEKLNAIFELNGIQIIKSKNEIDDVIEGVSLKLLNAQEDGESPETLSVSPDKESIKEELKAFVDAYNEVIKYLNERTGVDPSKNQRGELAGNFTFLNLRFDLRTIMASYVSGIEEGIPSSLNQLGIKIGSDGTLTLDDEEKFDQAIDKGSSVISDIFNSETGIGTLVNDILEDFVSFGGKIDSNKKAINRQIDSIDRRIESYNTRLYIRELSIRRELADMQRILSRLNSQQAMLQNSGFLNISNFGNLSAGGSGGFY